MSFQTTVLDTPVVWEVPTVKISLASQAFSKSYAYTTHPHTHTHMYPQSHMKRVVVSHENNFKRRHIIIYITLRTSRPSLLSGRYANLSVPLNGLPGLGCPDICIPDGMLYLMVMVPHPSYPGSGMESRWM